MPPEPAATERHRLRALQRLAILDTPPEAGFDLLAESAAHLCRAPIALITFVAETRQWFKAAVGTRIRETPRTASFCTHALGSAEVMVVEDAARDERFQHNPLVTGEPHVRAYAGAPVVVDGLALGTVCVLDRQPRPFTELECGTLTRYARMVAEVLTRRASGGPVPAPVDHGPHLTVAFVVTDALGRVMQISDLARESLGVTGDAFGRELHDILDIHWVDGEQGSQRGTGPALLVTPDGRMMRAFVTVTPSTTSGGSIYAWSEERTS